MRTFLSMSGKRDEGNGLTKQHAKARSRDGRADVEDGNRVAGFLKQSFECDHAFMQTVSVHSQGEEATTLRVRKAMHNWNVRAWQRDVKPDVDARPSFG